MKVIIAGSRNFNDYELLKAELNVLIHHQKVEEVVSGTAKGADKLGEKWANEYGFSIKRFPANWDEFGKSAGYIRNEEMAKYATHCVVFWDGESKGTKHMINLAEKHNLKTKVILIT